MKTLPLTERDMQRLRGLVQANLMLISRKIEEAEEKHDHDSVNALCCVQLEQEALYEKLK